VHKTPCSEHPQVIDQSYLTSWNNKQAKKYSAADDNWAFGSVFRNKPLDDRIQAGIAGGGKMSLVELIDAMEDAGTVDLRGDAVLPVVLKVLRRKPIGDPELQHAVDVLAAWQKSGAHRRDANADGVYEDAEAIRIMDAWWPRLVVAQFKPTLGDELFARIENMLPVDDHNRPDHLGSAFQGGWWGYVSKDLRSLLKKGKGKGKGKAGKKSALAAKKGKGKVKGAYSRIYCGGGKLNKCRKTLLASLDQALEVPESELYPGVEGCTEGNNQWCYDAIEFRPVGLLTQPFIHWINRPTFQQVVEVQGHR
jgi:Penicillin amidase